METIFFLDLHLRVYNFDSSLNVNIKKVKRFMNKQEKVNMKSSQGLEKEPAGEHPDSTIDLYRNHVVSFQKMIDTNGLDKAIEQYGFTIIHSLDPRAKMEAFQEYGFKPKTAADHYNLGILEAEQEEYQSAITHFEKALEHNPEMIETVFNLALLYERMGDKKKAITHWKDYAAATVSDQEKSKIEAHIKEL